MPEQSWRLMSKTRPGTWSIWLIVVMPLLFVIGSSFADSLYESVAAGSTIVADIGARPVLALTMLAGMAAGISGFITGLLAIFKHKEKAFLVYLSTLIGGFLIIFLIAEMAFPH
jgi:hypothetical protein